MTTIYFADSDWPSIVSRVTTTPVMINGMATAWMMIDVGSLFMELMLVASRKALVIIWL